MLPPLDPLGGRCAARVLSVAVGPRLVAAAFGANCVAVYATSAVDGSGGEPLCTIGLPARAHAHFHRNVVVVNSLSAYGRCVCIEDTRIALSALCHPGDWGEELRDADGEHYVASSLVVVQEMGPSWLAHSRTSPPHGEL
uniref:Uncharacterized protein n=1 Tax=Coccolithus braarudii TaxID=221442 RepID=A0A7S0PW87_9EUKA